MANLTRWDPFQDMVSLRDAMNQLFEESFVRGVPTASGVNFVPALDFSESPEAYHIELAVPGMKAEDLNVTFENNMLTISGEVRQDEEKKERHYHRVERRYGRFERSMTLPAAIKAEAINARLENGVLLLDLPKTEEVKPRKITVGVK